MSQTPAIETEGLTKRFGEFTAVEDLDLRVDTGTVVSLLGPNGAGKTTTVRMLATLLRPDAGNARVAGYDVVHQAPQVRRLISLTGQFAALDPHLTARENLVLMARLRGRGRREAADVTEQLIERFAIDGFRNRLVKNLSGGERRRVDLAAGLIDIPHVLVLDEPTTGLDPRSRQVVWSTIRTLVDDGVTLLLTTQYLDEADELADRIVVIDHGHVIAGGTPAKLKAETGGARLEVTLSEANPAASGALEPFVAGAVHLSQDGRRLRAPVRSGGGLASTVVRALDAAGITVDDVEVRQPSLDDVFFALTGRPAELAGERDEADLEVARS